VAGLTYVLIPGRHHLLTRFQARYLHELVGGQLTDIDDQTLGFSAEPTLVWAVTSANHQNTRRNPVPANRREAAIELFSLRERFRSLVVPIFDTRPTERFAEITLKAIAAGVGGLSLDPANCVVAVSTPSVIEMYQSLGFRIASLELNHSESPLRAWQVLELCAAGDPGWREHAHEATIDVFDRYSLAAQVAMVLGDPVVGQEGSLTETRNYRAYAASFEASAERKWRQARPFVVPGRIVDVGCATGAVLELASHEASLQESDLFGIEVSQHMFEDCVHKKSQGMFGNPNTFFFQRNILSGKVFADKSINTSLTFALTHEIISYAGGVDALARLAAALFMQATPAGVWINSDVCGPEGGDQEVLLHFQEPGLDHPPRDLERLPFDDAKSYLDSLTPAARFPQFAEDFDPVDSKSVRLSLSDAMEFMTKFAYIDSWLSECHERFCALAWPDWVPLVQSAGFEIDPRSGPWRNEWLVENMFSPTAELTTLGGDAIQWPTTHVFMVAIRPLTEA
jgi:SAM-dependent methyltransferase